MDKGDFRKLNKYHVIFLVQNVMIGMNLLTLPRDISSAGYNEWWIPILLGLIAQLTVFPMYWLCSQYPNDNLFIINEKIIGKWLGKLVNLVIIFYAILTITAVTQVYARLVQTVTLPDRTITEPMIAVLVVAIYITLGGIKSIARYCILSFFFTGWMLFYLKWGITKGNPSHVLPLFNTNIHVMYKALYEGFPAMFGYELVMIYYPYIREQKKMIKHVSIGLWIVIFFYVLVTMSSVIYFSRWQLENKLYPVLNLFKAVELTFIERIENFGIAVWVFLILTTVAAYLWTAKKGIDSLFVNRRIIHLYVVVLLAVLIIRGPLTMETQQMLYEEWAVYLGVGMILWPNFLLIIHWIRHARRKHQ